MIFLDGVIRKKLYLCKMKRCGLYIFKCAVFIFIFSCSAYGQVSHIYREKCNIDTNEVRKMYLDINVLSFFKNNEFSGEKVKGYTLPGFRLSPEVSLTLARNIRMDIGLSMLRYWGAEAYPCYSYQNIAEWKSEQYHKGLHVSPIMRAQWAVTPNFNVVLGSLFNRYNHSLCSPLYNNELNYTADPENGVQLLYDSKYFNADMWLNWQNFVFSNDDEQEMFTFGFSSKVNLLVDSSGFNISIPLQYLAQHRGGEITALELRQVQTISNYSAGLSFSYLFNRRYLKDVAFSCYYVGYIQNAGTLYPFGNGFGVYPELRVNVAGFEVNMAYWVSENFISILGSPHYNNLSLKTPDMLFDKMDIFTANIDYCYLKSKYYSLGVELGMVHYFPYTGDRPGFPKIERGTATSFTFGVYMNINPRIKVCDIPLVE